MSVIIAVVGCVIILEYEVFMSFIIFPIVSLLRRGAGSIAYVDTDLQLVGERKRLWVNFSKKTLEESVKPKLYKLSSSLSSKAREIEICKEENAIYTSLLEDKLYTVFLGPDIVEDGVRYAHIGVCIGIQRLSQETPPEDTDPNPSQQSEDGTP